MNAIQPPGDAPRHLWAVAEVRRTAVLLHASNRTQMMGVMVGVTALFLTCVSLVALIMVWGWWRNAERNAVLASVGRWHLDQWRARNNHADTPAR